MSELDYIQEKLRGYMNDTADHMAGGGCENYESYNYMCGMIKAFATIEREIIDLKERIEQN